MDAIRSSHGPREAIDAPARLLHGRIQRSGHRAGHLGAGSVVSRRGRGRATVSCIRLDMTSVQVVSESERRRIEARWRSFFKERAAQFRARLAEYEQYAELLGETPREIASLPAPPSDYSDYSVASIEAWTHACRPIEKHLRHVTVDARRRLAAIAADLRETFTNRAVEAEIARLEATFTTEEPGGDQGRAPVTTLDRVVEGIGRNHARLLSDAAAEDRARAEDLVQACVEAVDHGDHVAAQNRLEELRFLVQQANDRTRRRPTELQRAQVLRSQLIELGVEDAEGAAHLDAVIDDGAPLDRATATRIERRTTSERLADALTSIGYDVPDDFARTLGGAGAERRGTTAVVARDGGPGADDGLRFRIDDDETLAVEVVRDTSALADAVTDRRIEDAWLTEDLPRLFDALEQLGVVAEVARRDPAGSHPLGRTTVVRSSGGRGDVRRRTRPASGMELRP